MPSITYDRRTDMESVYAGIRTDHGIVSASESPFISSFTSAMLDAYGLRLDEIYDLETELDISRCSEPFLNIWGKILGEGRGSYSYAVDTSLSNVRINLFPSTVVAGDITTDGGGIPIPRGLLLYGATSRVRTLDNTIINSDSTGVYVRVMADQQGVYSIPASSIMYCDALPVQMTGVDPTLAKNVTFTVSQASSINGGSSPVAIDVYRYILMRKGEAMGLFNEARLQTLLRIPDVVRIVVDEYQGGAIVYLDVTLPDIADIVVGIAQVLTSAMAGIGRSVVVSAPIYRKVQLQLRGDLKSTANENEAKSNLKAEVCKNINNISMGGRYDISDILSASVSSSGNSFSSMKCTNQYVGGRKATSLAISLAFNEKAYITTTDITIV